MSEAAEVLESPFAQAAAQLLELGYHPIPVIPCQKAPGQYVNGAWEGMNGWDRYSGRAPNERFELPTWSRFPDANIGIVLGSRVGALHVIAIDVDADDPDELDTILSALPYSHMVKKGAKGETRFYLASAEIKSKSYTQAATKRRLVDILTGNSARQTVMPPSVHPSGAVYRFTAGPVSAADLTIFAEADHDRLTDTLDALGCGAPAAEAGRQASPAGPGEGDTIWSEANDGALANLDAWVPGLDLYRCRRARQGYACVATWRPSSTGRPDSERKLNLSIQPNGILDMARTGGPKGDGRYSAIDVIMSAQGWTLERATLWLRDRLGLTDTGAPIALRATSSAAPTRPNLVLVQGDRIDPTTGEVFDAAPEATDGPADQFKFKVTLYADIDAEHRKAWVVEDLLGASELTVVYGAPGSGKSVLVGDIAAHVASGRPWFGRRVRPGLVLYLAAERAGLVKRRFAAWRKRHEVEAAPLAVLEGAFDLCHGLAHATEVARIAERLSARFGEPLAWIIIDTKAQVMAGGDPNSDQDVGALIASVAAIQAETGAHVTVVDHTPHADPRRMKGSGALAGASDGSFLVEKRDGVRLVSIGSKPPNDGPDELEIAFELESVELGRDEHGKPTTAPVVVQRQAGGILQGAAGPRRVTLSTGAQKVLSAYGRLLDENRDTPAPSAPGVKPGTRAVTIADLREKAFQLGLYAGEEPAADADFKERERFRDGRKKAFGRALDALEKQGRLRVEAGFAWEPAGNLMGMVE